MPTANPRLNITLTPSQHALLRSLSRHRGVPMSSILRELFEVSEPILRRVDRVLGAAAAAQNSYAESIRVNSAHAELEVAKLYDSAVAQFDQLAEVVEGSGGGEMDETAGAAPSSSTTPTPA